MSATKKQRYGILIILAVTVIGTIGSFAVMILSTQNNAKQQAQFQVLSKDYEAKQKQYEAQVGKQTDELSAKYYEVFQPYASNVAAFDINSAKDLSTDDLLVGEGEKITGKTKFASYYIGWDANGRIFDQSIDVAAKKLKAPLTVADGLDNASLIVGWQEGMKGMAIGGVRLITIPSDKAYGEAGSKDASGKETIAPNMPLKFIVMAIPLPEQIPQPDMTGLQKAYEETQQ